MSDRCLPFMVRRSGIICDPIWGSFPVRGSFAVQFGIISGPGSFADRDHLRACTDPKLCLLLYSQGNQQTSQKIRRLNVQNSVVNVFICYATHKFQPWKCIGHIRQFFVVFYKIRPRLLCHDFSESLTSNQVL